MPGACCVCMFSVSVSLNKLSMVVNIILAQVELLGLEELVEPTILVLLNEEKVKTVSPLVFTSMSKDRLVPPDLENNHILYQ